MQLEKHTSAADVREFYRRPAALTSAGRHSALLASLTRDVAELARVTQGLAVHEYMAPAYGFTVPDDRRWESHVRPLERMLDRIVELEPRPLAVERPIERRLIGVCRHFVALHVGMLRAKGIPARGRCGFGGYFNRGKFEDHWVTEYWNAAEQRWVLLDPQFDDVWIRELHIEHDVLDVPRDRFLVAGDAWARCRAGEDDPARFGIADMRGLWFIAGDIIRDIAALNGMEMLPWDLWGAMPRPGEPMNHAQLQFFDHLAAFSRSPDDDFDELRTGYESDDGLRVPATVFNSRLNRPETV